MKFFLQLLFLAVLAVSCQSVSISSSTNCGRHGDPCTLGCCEGLRCNAYAARCQVIFTEAELMAQRERILGRSKSA